MRIAIVNDTILIVEFLRKIVLSVADHEIVWVARNGAEAVEKCAADTPDLILMDLIMPVMDGFEATAAIRDLNLGYEPTIVAVSASVFDVTKEQCQLAGCDDYLVKPFNLEHLLDTIEGLTHIHWLYEDDDVSDNKEQVPADSEIIPPPIEQLSRLHTLIMMGDMDALQAEARSIAELAPQYAAFVDAITMLAHDFKLDELQNLIEQQMEVGN